MVRQLQNANHFGQVCRGASRICLPLDCLVHSVGTGGIGVSHVRLSLLKGEGRVRVWERLGGAPHLSPLPTWGEEAIAQLMMHRAVADWKFGVVLPSIRPAL